ncbi:unnamed protein product [Ceutorhynchus assimilis]|uniref:Uncharacterized protein n=1 Tax=Ceutorhynchus assimilis TaxID=467358 RepID=A0A9N9MV16_9CUCU|nr:unnamed protein product [Ceutorhynchus assimilis]
MTSLQCDNILQEDPNDGLGPETEFLSMSSIMESTNLIYETMRDTPRPVAVQRKRPRFTGRIKSAKPDGIKSKNPLSLLPSVSHIPLRSKPQPIKVPALIKTGSSSSCRPLSLSASRNNNCTDTKHTLEVQFINKNKMFLQMKRELKEKQMPVVELHKTLMKIKTKLEQFGKFVTLENIENVKSLPQEVTQHMRNYLEQIPKTTRDVCKSLLSSRDQMVEILEKLANSEFNLSDVSTKLETLKNEGQTLESSLEAVIAGQQGNINELVGKWESLSSSKHSEELEFQGQEHEKLMQESNNVINNLQRKMNERRVAYDKSQAELNGNMHSLRTQLRQLENDLQNERNDTKQIKSKHTADTKMIRTMKEKIIELENNKVISDAATADLQWKHTLLLENLKNKESQWNQEKLEMDRTMNQQEGILKQIAYGKTDYDATLEVIDSQKSELQNEIEYLRNQVRKFYKESKESAKERDEAREKCAELTNHIADIRFQNKEIANKVCDDMKHDVFKEAEQDLEIRELRDKVIRLERENSFLLEERMSIDKNKPSEMEKEVSKLEDCIFKHKLLLEESEKKLMQKSTDILNLRFEMQQLKEREETISSSCPTGHLQQIIYESQHRLDALRKMTIENEQTLEQHTYMMEKKDLEISYLKNLVQYRANITNLLKENREDLLLERVSLSKYSSELQEHLSSSVKCGKMKEELIKELQDMIESRDIQMLNMEKEIEDLESNLVITNDKRFKLQETIEWMEKEIQFTKARVIKLTDINTRSGRKKK